MNLKQYIYPIYSGGCIVGQGFLADGFFITAAHVIYDFPDSFTIICNNRFSFSNEKPAFIGEGNIYQDANKMDIALYKYEVIESPLFLSNYNPQKGDKYESYCINEKVNLFNLNPEHELSFEEAIYLNNEEGNYFYCQCKRYGGSSGSPLLMGNEVVGIMHGGDKKGLCAFLKAYIVKKKLY